MHSYKPHPLVLSVNRALFPGEMETLLSVCLSQAGEQDCRRVFLEVKACKWGFSAPFALCVSLAWVGADIWRLCRGSVCAQLFLHGFLLIFMVAFCKKHLLAILLCRGDLTLGHA